jgi:formylglycine-generating enzyme required for sulfatase activity
MLEFPFLPFTFFLDIMSVVHVIPIYASKRETARYFIETLPNNIDLEMVEIPAGSFNMGAPESEKESLDSERPQREVALQTFCIGKYPITQAQWRSVATLPQINQKLNPDPSHFKGDKRPVECVSWLDAMEFCRRLSKYTRREYRLPSEAEWEYACRAKTTTSFHFGETITTDYVNYDGNYPYGDAQKGEYRKETTDVGSLKGANAFGLYDMHGNVWEWCADDWHDSHKGAPPDTQIRIKDIKNYEAPETRKLLRGGSWHGHARYCRSAYRGSSNARDQDNIIGFRVVCSISLR